MRSVSVQTELMKCEECEHSKNLKEEKVKDFEEKKLLDVYKHDRHEYELEKWKDAVEEARREEKEFIKCEYCEYSAHNFNNFWETHI